MKPLSLYRWTVQRWVGEYTTGNRVMSTGTVYARNLTRAQDIIHARYPDRNWSEISTNHA